MNSLPALRPARLRFHLAPAALGQLTLLAAALAGVALVVSACGGAGGAGAAAGGGATGQVSIAVADAPGLDFNKAYITIREVWFHQTDAAASGDDGWRKFALNAPVTVDLASLSNGALAEVFSSLTLPVGSYRQIRIHLVDSDEALTASASALGLQTNNEIQYSGALGVARVAPLEIASPAQGISLHGNFEVKAEKALRLLVDFDIGHDIVRFRHGPLDAFTMKPTLRYFDLDAAGAIVGQLDSSACSALATPCTDFVIKAEQSAADGAAVRQVTRATTPRADGSFVLYPLPAGASFDVLVRGRHTQTLVVRGVPAVSGGTPTQGATQLSATPLALAGSDEYSVNLSPAANPTGGWVQFYQSAGAGELPYEVRFRHQDPFTGTFFADQALVTAPLLLGDYRALGSPVFNPVTPLEGAGAYLVKFGGLGLSRTEAGTVRAPALPATLASIAPPVMQPAANVAQFGSISGTVRVNRPGHWNRGQVVVARMGSIVNSSDITAALVSGGVFQVPMLPAGSAAKPLPSGYYYAYARVWSSERANERARIVALPGLADLRQNASATLNLTLP